MMLLFILALYIFLLQPFGIYLYRINFFLGFFKRVESCLHLVSDEFLNPYPANVGNRVSS
jgi:hypothetical protein